MESKYLKYKIKYCQLKKQLDNKNNQTGGEVKEEKLEYFNEKNINDKNPSIYLFKAGWCGHCKHFRETWNALANKFSTKVNFIAYDSNENKKEMKEWRVNGFPTIIFRKGSKASEFNGDRDIDSVIKFIENQL